ncbi:MAG: pentapeptide repeat-containing protein [Pseudomonadota bacterium]
MTVPQTSLSGRRRLSQGELDLMVAAHERFLAGKPGGKRASLRFLDLSLLSLVGRNLTDADLSASIFDGARMGGVILERANLFGCDLRKADLRRANLRRADLRGVCLKGANLAQADLTQADFREGQIAIPHPRKGVSSLTHEPRIGQVDGAIFAGATLDELQLDGVSALATDFSDCSLRGAKLTGANLKDANLSGANLDGARVEGTNLEGADLSGAVISGVDVASARISGARLDNCLSSPTPEAVARSAALLELAQANQAWCETGGQSGAPARFDGADLRPLGDHLKGFRLTAMSAKGACLVGLDLAGAQLQGANLEGADLRGVSLVKADLRGARLAGANLGKADLRGATLAVLPLGPNRSNPANLGKARARYVQLQMADLMGAVLDGADLRGADLTGARLVNVSMVDVDTAAVRGLKAA